MTWNTLNGLAPKIIAHRGASGYRPEHTLAAYELAIAQGADALEPDIVASRDGVLYVRHDAGLACSTDIAARAEFAPRARLCNGVRDWWICDFDACEIDTLRAIQPMPERGTQYDRLFGIPRLADLLALARRTNAQRERAVVIDIEIKNPELFAECGIDVLGALAGDLETHGGIGPQAPVWLESFDHEFLRRASERCGNPCFALLEHAPDDSLLRQLAVWVYGIAPAKRLLRDAAGRDRGLVAAAHALGMEAHAWTFRDDGSPAPFATPAEEMDAAFALGVDALFCDFPDAALAARSNYAVSGLSSANHSAAVARLA